MSSRDSDQYVKNILLRPTERDKQRKIGASQLSNACTKCLAEDMLGVVKPRGVYDLGSIVGTAIHEYLDHRNEDENARKEMKVVIGEIPGYGVVGSTTDLYRTDLRQVVDFKTTTRDKLAKYKRAIEYPRAEFDTDEIRSARSTVERYFRQAQLYAWAVVQSGNEVERVSIVFICRDGQIIDRDIWGYTMPYDETLARKVFNRAKALWKYLEGGGSVDDLTENEHCYFCNAIRPTLIEDVEL